MYSFVSDKGSDSTFSRFPLWPGQARNLIIIVLDMLTCVDKSLVEKSDKFVVNYDQTVRWALPPECFK